MKRLRDLVVLIFTLFCLMNNQGAYSQPVLAAVNETNYGVSVNGRYTGNDILDLGSDRLEVSVWEDVSGSSGFGWNMYNGTNHPGATPLQYPDAQDPDVSLVLDNNGTAHALAVYYSLSGSGYYIEIYDWDPVLKLFVLNGSPTLLYYATSFGTSVNIDADWETNFIVVFDNATFLNAITGNIFYSSLVINNSGAAVNIGTAAKGSYPDVCIFEKSGSDRVTYCYIDYLGDLYVEYDSFNAIASGSNASVVNRVVSSPSGINHYESPRIACPNVNSGHKDDWTTVVLESNSSSIYYVQEFNWNNAGSGLTGPLLINGGGFTTYNYTSLQCYGPVVAYNDQTTITIGWNVVDPAPGVIFTIYGTHPVVSICNMSGIPTQGNEWDVPVTLTLAHTMDYLSLAGRYTNDGLFCTFDYQDVQDVYYKTVTGISGASNLRNQLINSHNSDIEYFNNIKNETVSGTLFDILGDVIFQKPKISYQDFRKVSCDYLKIHPNSIYLIEVISDDNKHSLRSKLNFSN